MRSLRVNMEKKRGKLPRKSHSVATCCDNGVEAEAATPPDDTPSIYRSFRPVVIAANVLGMLPISNAMCYDSKDLLFKWKSVPTLFTLTFISSLVVVSLASLYFFVVTPTPEYVSIEMMALRPREALYHISATCLAVVILNAARKLPEILRRWDGAAQNLRKYAATPGQHLHLKVSKTVAISLIFMASAVTEHTMHDVALPFQFCPNITDFFQCYYEKGNEYMAQNIPYNKPLAVATLIFNKFATLVWNYHDLLVSLLSTALTVHFKLISTHLKDTVDRQRTSEEWKTIREDHMALCEIVNMLDDVISFGILLSYATNLYFICIQVFYAIRPNQREPMEMLYFCVSLYHFFVRICFLTFSAAAFNEEASVPLQYLLRCPTCTHCLEVTRFINNLTLAPVAFTGYKFFFLNRGLFLAMISIIFTYELILLDVT